MAALPSDYTACEEYRGRIIAIRHGRYSIWTPGADKGTGFFTTRANARREIDAQEGDA